MPGNQIYDVLQKTFHQRLLKSKNVYPVMYCFEPCEVLDLMFISQPAHPDFYVFFANDDFFRRFEFCILSIYSLRSIFFRSTGTLV